MQAPTGPNTHTRTQQRHPADRRPPVPWILLIVAGLFEVAWAIGLKYTEGFTRFWPSVLTLAAMACSVLLLGLAMKSLPVGTSYAVWVGIGAIGTQWPRTTRRQRWPSA